MADRIRRVAGPEILGGVMPTPVFPGTSFFRQGRVGFLLWRFTNAGPEQRR
jgi:hypothetical protein